MSRYLLAFDFDHTLVDENSDLYVIKLAPNGKLPEEISDLFEDSGWTDYMAEIFKYLHYNGTQPSDILSCVSEIQLTAGMRELLSFTSNNSNHFDHIIISDANSVFIDQILSACGLSDVMTRVFTNPAKFDSSGRLTLSGYHVQDWCSLSTRNMCKGHILQNFIKERQETSGIEYTAVLYVGDGYNDLCPSLTLRPQDFVLPRVGFRLDKLIQKMAKENKPVSRTSLSATVVPWESGLEVLKLVEGFPLK